MKSTQALARSVFAAIAAVSLAATSVAQTHWTCGCQADPAYGSLRFAPPSDCAYASNTPSSAYDPLFVYEIPVAFHVITNNAGTGDLSDQLIRSQIDRLNEDFSGQALGLGSDTGIRFRLATSDPAGLPTTGITRDANNSWFGDNGNYGAALGWDTNRYLNIYSLRLGQAAGYVPDLPQGGIVGTAGDRIVMNYQVIGGAQTEMILAHEVGHFLGLYHTFGAQQPNCNNTDCTTQGDLICDTNPHTQPSQNCGGGNGNCGVPAPDHNYMNYLDISCMYEFTTEQVQRMRCSLENWRPDLADMVDIGTSYCPAVANSTGSPANIVADGSRTVADNDLRLTARSLPVGSFGFFINARMRGNVANPGGSQGNLCLGGTVGRHQQQIQQADSQGLARISVDLMSIPRPNGAVVAMPGQTWDFQYWYRDSVSGMPASNFTNGTEVLLN